MIYIDYLSQFTDWRPTQNYWQRFSITEKIGLDEVGAEFKTIFNDAKGDYIWDLVPAYGYDNKFPMGHGAKSVFFIQQFIKLSMEEIACIYWHMGAYTGENTWKELNEAYNKYPLALALHEADMESTYLLEKE